MSYVFGPNQLRKKKNKFSCFTLQPSLNVAVSVSRLYFSYSEFLVFENVVLKQPGPLTPLGTEVRSLTSYPTTLHIEFHNVQVYCAKSNVSRVCK